VTIGSIVIPAHNEAAVIIRALAPLAPLAERGVEIIVSANGCTDHTAARARTIPGVEVLESSTRSKAQALNKADSVATTFPRLYLDADVTITADATLAVIDRLRLGDVLAARPSFRYDTTGADRLVAAYYRARGRVPAMHEHLWGAGAYALSEEGHARLGCFPVLTADDLYVDGLFERTQIDIVPTDPVEVRCPRTWRALLATLRRVQAGKEQVSERHDIVRVGGLRPLLAGVRGPGSLADAIVYAGFSLLARMLSRSDRNYWYRDETNRPAAPQDAPVASPVGHSSGSDEDTRPVVGSP
jgi:glycosyltransferase involved in cell wall biosynthesis